MNDLLDSDRAGESYGLSRKSDQRAVTNQPEIADDIEEEYDDDIELEEDKNTNPCIRCCRTIACFPISMYLSDFSPAWTAVPYRKSVPVRILVSGTDFWYEIRCYGAWYGFSVRSFSVRYLVRNKV